MQSKLKSKKFNRVLALLMVITMIFVSISYTVAADDISRLFGRAHTNISFIGFDSDIFPVAFEILEYADGIATMLAIPRVAEIGTESIDISLIGRNISDPIDANVHVNNGVFEVMVGEYYSFSASYVQHDMLAARYEGAEYTSEDIRRFHFANFKVVLNDIGLQSDLSVYVRNIMMTSSFEDTEEDTEIISFSEQNHHWHVFEVMYDIRYTLGEWTAPHTISTSFVNSLSEGLDTDFEPLFDIEINSNVEFSPDVRFSVVEGFVFSDEVAISRFSDNHVFSGSSLEVEESILQISGDETRRTRIVIPVETPMAGEAVDTVTASDISAFPLNGIGPDGRWYVYTGTNPVARSFMVFFNGIGQNFLEPGWPGVTGATGYRLFRNNTNTPVGGNLPASARGHRDTGLPTNTVHTYIVRAVNSAGTVLAQATSSQIRTLPNTPNAPNLTNVTTNSVTVSWNSVAGATRYSVQRNGSTVWTGTGTSWPNTGLLANTRYTYTVTAQSQPFGHGEFWATPASASSTITTLTQTAPIHRIDASPRSPHFGTHPVGYAPRPTQTITVTNTGNQNVTLNSLPNVTNWTLAPGANWTSSIAPGASRNFTIRPNNGLAAGTYAPSFNVTGSNGTSVQITPWFGVTGPLTHTVTYNGNSNTGGSAPAQQSFTAHQSFSLRTNTGNLTRTGFTFSGWNTRADGGGTDFNAGQQVSFPAGNLTLFARWRVVPIINLNNISNITLGQPVTIAGSSSLPTNISSNPPFRMSAVVRGPGLPVGGHWLGEVTNTGTYSGRQFIPPQTGTYTVTLYSRSFPENDLRTGQGSASRTFTVTAGASSISASNTTPNFGSHPFGYAERPTQTITITNTGNQNVTLNALPNVSNWTLTPGNNWTTAMAPGATRSFTIRPNNGLAVGNHDRSFNITGSGGASVQISPTFTVTAATAAPVITTQPADQTVTVGGVAEFTVSAAGNPAPSFQWQVSTNNGSTWTNLAGQTSSSLRLTNVQAVMNNNRYRVVVLNPVGSVNSRAALLTVNPPARVATNVRIDDPPQSLEIPNSGSRTTTIRASILDQFGSVMSNLSPTEYIIENPIPTGVSINSTTGVISVSSSAQPGRFFIRARYAVGGINITSPGVPIDLVREEPPGIPMVNVDVHLYSRDSALFTRFLLDSRAAAEPFRSTFNIDMRVHAPSWVNTPVHSSCNLLGQPGHNCVEHYRHHELQSFVEVISGASNRGIHSLKVIRNIGEPVSCHSSMIGFRSVLRHNNTVSTGVNATFMGLNFIPKRIYQHEWSHSYGAPEGYRDGLCTGDCIMRLDYSDDSAFLPGVWCSRCQNIIMNNRTNWR